MHGADYKLGVLHAGASKTHCGLPFRIKLIDHNVTDSILGKIQMHYC